MKKIKVLRVAAFLYLATFTGLRPARAQNPCWESCLDAISACYDFCDPFGWACSWDCYTAGSGCAGTWHCYC